MGYFRNLMARAISGRPSQAPAAPPTVTPFDGGHTTSHATSGKTSEQLNREFGPGLPPKFSRLTPPPLDEVTAIAVDVFGANAFLPATHGNGVVANFRYAPSQPVHDMIGKCSEQEFGPEWSQPDVDLLKDLHRRWKNLEYLQQEFTVANISRLTHRKMEAMASAMARGESTSPSDIPTREVQEIQIHEWRKATRIAKSELSTATFELLTSRSKKRQKAATKMLLVQYKGERSDAAKMGLPFSASALLKSLIWFCLIGWEEETSNFLPGCFATLAPQNFYFGKKLFDLELTPDQIAIDQERQKILDDSERARIEHQEFLAEKQKEEDAKKSAVHRQLVKDVSKINDELREKALAQSAAARQEKIPRVRIVP